MSVGKRKAHEVEQGDADDVDVCQIADNDGATSLSMVKMKFAALCKNDRLGKQIGTLVKNMNRLLGEAYAFSNFHVLHVLRSGQPAPVLNRNFFYRCLVAVGVTNVRAGTLLNLEVTQGLFDRLRGNEGKVDVRGCSQVLADLSIIMATMSSNHLWVNLERRVVRYLRWKYPELKAQHQAIVQGLVREPKAEATALIQGQGPTHVSARELLTTLRSIMPLATKVQAPRTAHLTLPLYLRILEDTEVAETSPATEPSPATERRKRLRTFSLLPTKGGFTICHIPISNMTFLQLLKDLKLEKFYGDGRNTDHRALWAKYFNLNAIETTMRRFDLRIVTDGYSVSAQMAKPSSLRCNCHAGHGLDNASCRVALSDAESSRCVGVDPGFSDVVTVSEVGMEKARSFSSARYYELAGFNLSARRTRRWNAETQAIVQDMPSNETADLFKMEDFVRSYLRALPALIEHRAAAGYRYMRLFRHIRRSKAIRAISDFIAPPGKFSVVMFGDWNGGAGSAISRRTCGPLEEVKFTLRSRTDVDLRSVDEFRTSMMCSGCNCKLSNMRAVSKVKNRSTGEWEARRSKVHKVLHCSNSVDNTGATRGCGTTWDRDVNASRNILTLGLLALFEKPRPTVFCRSTAPQRTSRGRRATDRPGNPQEPGPSLLSLMPVRLIVPSWYRAGCNTNSQAPDCSGTPLVLTPPHWVTGGVPE